MNGLAALGALAMTCLNLGALALAGLAGPPAGGGLPRPLRELAKMVGPAADPGPVDDGTYLARIDPLGGRWLVERIGDVANPGGAAWVQFSDAFFLTTFAGCGGGQAAFYRLEGAGLTVTRREPVAIGKCRDRASAGRERALAGFVDQAVRWARPAPDRLEIASRDGQRAVFSRPVMPVPGLAGRWRVEAIDGVPLVTRRPAEVVFSLGGISATADCNQWSAPLTIGGGKLAIGGGVQTQMGCPADQQANDARLFAAVAGAKRFVLTNDDRLRLEGAATVLLGRFPPPDRRLAGRYAHCGGTVGGVGHAGPVTLAIGGATMSDNAGCTARYTAREERLELALAGTRACRIAPAPADGFPEVGGSISPLALLRPDGFGFSDDGRLFLRTNRGLLSLCREGEPRRFGD